MEEIRRATCTVARTGGKGLSTVSQEEKRGEESIGEQLVCVTWEEGRTWK